MRHFFVIVKFYVVLYFEHIQGNWSTCILELQKRENRLLIKSTHAFVELLVSTIPCLYKLRQFFRNSGVILFCLLLVLNARNVGSPADKV